MIKRVAMLAVVAALIGAVSAGLAQGDTKIVGNLVFSVSAKLSPKKLPR